MAKRQSDEKLIELVQKEMEEILPQHNGVRMMRLQEMIAEKLPGEKAHSMGALFVDITRSNPLKFARDYVPGKGVFYSWVGIDDSDIPMREEHDAQSVEVKESDSDSTAPHTPPKPKESDFYGAFAKYLQYADKSSDSEDSQNLEECSVAIPWGDKGKKSSLGKWATPDVIGVFKPEDYEVVKFPHEIVSAEIKAVSDTARILEGFGQACAYRLFSHKVYLVVPDDDSLFLARLEAMCHLMGLGLIVFDLNEENVTPSIFSVRLRARKQEPDTAYVNQAIPEEIIKELYK